jgi:phosphatidylserine/phosphatidylglycerophosphate/cardiolipin synthase-like enzyme
LTVERDIERVLARLSTSQVEALARATETRARPDGSLAASVPGSGPAAHAAVSDLAASWSSTAGLTGAGIALALRTGLRAQRLAEATRSQPVWTGPGTVGEQRLTSGVLHELISTARQRILILSFAAHTVPSVAADLEAAVAAGCSVDVVFETGADSAGAYRSHDTRPFGDVAGIRRWCWPADQRARGSLLHAKALIIDGERALIGSANLTQRALEANLEVGVLVRDPTVAAALEAHVRGLMSSGTLTFVENS